MIFVTTGQRIAVENFSKGVIYKVTFTDESISYMMCVGIGKDFVMLQSTDPLLFSLTMQSASRVSTIDVHDPTPPEPPTPIENALQYQTGEPPFTFTTTENSLFSWYIEGEAGVKTANLIDNSFFTSTRYITVTPITNGVNLTGTYYAEISGISLDVGTTYYMSWTEEVVSGTVLAAWRVQYTDNTFSYQTPSGNALTIAKDVSHILFYVNSTNTQASVDITNIMFNTGIAPLPYEPYGKYKISISTNEHTTTIYLDEPIAEGEKLYSVNVDAQIVTDIGENTLSISDPQPPEMQIVYGIYAED